MLHERNGCRSLQPRASHKQSYIILQAQKVSWSTKNEITQLECLCSFFFYFIFFIIFSILCLCRYAVAESDCNLAIALDSKYFKAYARRGAARFALKKYEPALEGNKRTNKTVYFNLSALR